MKILKKIKSTKCYNWSSKHLELLSLIIGSVIVSIWTFILFFAKPSTFDLIGQQLLSRQWINGFHNGAVVGPTNYILKIIFLYIPLDHLPGSPRFKLILITLFINIVTYILLVLILKRLWKLFFPKLNNSFYLATLWMALIAGSMYWIEFSNSRNLEIVGGLYLIYLGCSLTKQTRYPKYLLVLILSSILFFADPLQLYMSAVPLIVYVYVRQFPIKRVLTDHATAIKLTLSVGIGYLISKVFVKLAEKLFGLKFIAVTTHTNGLTTLKTWIHGFIPGFKQAFRLYVGGYQLGRIVEAINILFVLAIVVVGAYYVYKKLIPKKFAILVFCFWLIDMAFYITSGQSLQSGTSRYLIMTVPFVILLIAAVLSTKHQLRKLIITGSVLIVLINCYGLISALKYNWNPKFTKDAHIYSVINYVASSKQSYAFASMDSSMPADYFSNNKVSILPLSCNPGGLLTPSYLFFDASFYKHTLGINQSSVALILDGDQITNNPYVCSLENIYSQFGSYQQIKHLSDGSTVLIYKPEQILRVLGL
jgi:hypothetical protein